MNVTQRRDTLVSETPSRRPLKDLIRDALSSNPRGLRSEEIFQWLKTNRSEALIGRDDEKLRASVNSTLSTQSNKKEPAIWKYKDDHSKKAGYIWRLAGAGNADGEDRTLRSPHQKVPEDATDVDTSEPAVTTPSIQQRDLHSLDTTTYTSAQSPNSDEHPLDSHSEAGDTIPDTSAAAGFTQKLDDEGRRVTTAAASSQQSSSRSSSRPRAEERYGNITIGSGDGDGQNDAFPSPLLAQQIYYGKLIMEVQALSRKAVELRKEVEADRANLADLDMLEATAEHANLKAQELEKAAQEARAAADEALHDLQLARHKESQIKMKEEELKQASKDFAESRAKLEID